MKEATFATTHCTASMLGRNAIVIDLTDALRDQSELPEAHLTLLFRNRGYSTDDVRSVRTTIDYWLLTNGYDVASAAEVPFHLTRWGEQSDLVHGPLFDLCEHVRAVHNGKLHWTKDCRAPHVALRRRTTRGSARIEG